SYSKIHDYSSRYNLFFDYKSYLTFSKRKQEIAPIRESERSSFIPPSTVAEEIEVGSTELLLSKEEADEGRDTTIYFCNGREAVSPGPLPGSSFTKDCSVEVALGTVLVTGEAEWEELRVMT
ncbi:hypothetical protein GOODEAATRI_024443, partial [Goodea atripinnis]